MACVVIGLDHFWIVNQSTVAPSSFVGGLLVGTDTLNGCMMLLSLQCEVRSHTCVHNYEVILPSFPAGSGNVKSLGGYQ
jgi:hypothetical protein